jgi:DNA-binding HxlR family transcriptional regulator
MTMFKVLDKKYVAEILELLENGRIVEFSKIKKYLDIDKSYLSRLLSEMTKEGLLVKFGEKRNKRITIPSYGLSEVGISRLRVYRQEHRYEDRINIIREVLSERYELITNSVSVKIDPNRVEDFSYNYLPLKDRIDNGYSLLEVLPVEANEIIKEALTFGITPSLSYRYGKNDNDILYIYFEDHELYEYGDSVYNQLNGTVARIWEIYGKKYLFLSKKNLNEVFLEIDRDVYEELPLEHQIVSTGAGPDDDPEFKKSLEELKEDTNETIQLRKKEMLKKRIEYAVVKSDKEIAEKIIQYIENLK